MSHDEVIVYAQRRQELLPDYLRMDPHQLGRQQLIYELKMRQCPVTGTLRSQAEAIRAMLKHEGQDGTDLVHLDHSPYVPDIDLQECTALLNALETELLKGRIDSHTLRTLSSQAIRLSARLTRVCTAGSLMAQQKANLFARSEEARVAVKYGQNPFEEPPEAAIGQTDDIIPTTTSAAAANEMVHQIPPDPPATSSEIFAQMVHSTPDHPPITSAVEMQAIEERLRSIYARIDMAGALEPPNISPVASVVQTTRSDSLPTPATAPSQSEGATGGQANALGMGTPENHTTQYRERVESPEGVHITDISEADENAMGRYANIPNSTTTAFRMKPATIQTTSAAWTVPNTCPTSTVVTCTGAIPRQAKLTEARSDFRTPFLAVSLPQRMPRSIFATATSTPITTAIVSASGSQATRLPPTQNQLTYTVSAPTSSQAQYAPPVPTRTQYAPPMSTAQVYMAPMYQPINTHPNWWPFQSPWPSHNAFGTPIHAPTTNAPHAPATSIGDQRLSQRNSANPEPRRRENRRSESSSSDRDFSSDAHGERPRRSDQRSDSDI